MESEVSPKTQCFGGVQRGTFFVGFGQGGKETCRR